MSSRKRSSENQSRREEVELQLASDDVAEEVQETDFARAGGEVLATRRIVSARRRAGTAAPQIQGSVNPFANLQFVGPSPEPSNNPIDQSKASPEEAKVLEENDSETAEEVTSAPRESKPENAKVVPGGEENGQEAAPVTLPGSAQKDGVKVAKPPLELKGDEVVGESAPATSNEVVPEVPASKNAFAALGKSSSGFGGFSSAFSFGPITGFGSKATGFSFASGSGSAFGSTASSTGSFPALASVFGSNAGGGAASGTDGVHSESASIQPATTAVVSLSEVTVETGEESEMSVFEQQATLFEYDGSKWKGRGSGEVRLKAPIDSSSGKSARIVMRGKGNLRLILNAGLFADLKLSPMEPRGVSFAVVNASSENSDLVTYALRFKDAESAKKFTDLVDANKGSLGSSEVASASVEAAGNGKGPAKDSEEGNQNDGDQA